MTPGNVPPPVFLYLVPGGPKYSLWAASKSRDLSHPQNRMKHGAAGRDYITAPLRTC